MPRPVHFEIHADQPERAVAFYERVFGWSSQKWEGPEPYWLLTTGPDSEPGINGGVLHRQSPPSGDSAIAYVCTIGVESLDEYVGKAQANGATLAMPKMAVPGIGWLAYCKDTEGNLFGMLQADTKAQ
jgi:predicted enzyme related to lactoylglutathione lyase